MGSFETNLHLTAAATTVPYIEHIPTTLNGKTGYVPKSGKMFIWGLGAALDGRWTFLQLNPWCALTASIDGGFVTGNRHSAFFASTLAGFRLAPTSTRYQMTIEAGYGLLRAHADASVYGTGIQNLPVGYGAVVALGVVAALPQLCKSCQVGARVEASTTGPIHQERGLITFGYQSRTDDAAPEPPRPAPAPLADPPRSDRPLLAQHPAPHAAPSPAPAPSAPADGPKSPVETQLEAVEDRIIMIRAVYHKDLKACLPTIRDIGYFLAWTRGDGDPTSCRLPILQPKLKEIETDLEIIRAASAGQPALQPRIEAAVALLRTTPSLLVQKGMELLVGPQADSRLSRTMILGKAILAAIGKRDQKVVIAAFLRYEAALNALQRIFNENALSMGRENAGLYKGPQQVVDCLLTELSCPTNLATELTVPALKKQLGLQ